MGGQTAITIDASGMFSDFTDIKADITIDVRSKQGKQIGVLEALVVCEEQGHELRRTEVERKMVTDSAARYEKGQHELKCEIKLGKLEGLPSSMDLIETVGVFWWLELYMDGESVCERCPLAVFPTRRVSLDMLADLDQQYETVDNKMTMIVSTNDTATPTKPKPKVFSSLFGERYRHPDPDELVDIGIVSRLFVPKAGVMQSPHKAQLGLHVKSPMDEAVILSKITVSLISQVEPLGSSPKASGFASFGSRKSLKTAEGIITCLEISPELVLPHGWLDVSGEIADMEIPPLSESVSTDILEASYEVKVTLAFRSLNMTNLSSWTTINAPINLFPSVIKDLSEPFVAHNSDTLPSFGCHWSNPQGQVLTPVEISGIRAPLEGPAPPPYGV